jgi:protein pelota
LNVDAEKMEKISIIKEEWKHHQIKRLEEAVKQSKNPLVLFVSLDDDNATIAVLRQSGIQKITDVDSKRSGKMYENQSEETSKEYFGEVLSIVENNMTKNTAIVVLGPGFTREHFVDFSREKNPSLFERVHLHPTGNSGMNGVHEAIKTGVVKQITKENRVVIETTSEFFMDVLDEIECALLGFGFPPNTVKEGFLTKAE